MRTNAAGRALIKSFEGCRLRAYLCPAGVWTCGWGSTGPDVNKWTMWTQAQADARFIRDVESREPQLNALLSADLNDNQYSAIMSWVFNAGAGRFRGSTLRAVINRGDFDRVPTELRKWVRGGGVILPGLVARREAEIALWCKSP